MVYKSLIDEQTKNELKNIINEELTINNEINLLTTSIYSEIKKSIKNVKYSPLKQDVSFGILHLKNINIFGLKFSIKIAIYNTNKKEFYKQMCDEYDCYNGYTNFTDNIININIGVLSGSRYIDFEGILQHEIEHVFQYTKKNNQINTKIGQSIYKKAFNIIQNSDNYNKYQFYCAYLIYCLSDNEVDAFVNQLYRDIVNGNALNDEPIIQNSTIMQNYLNCKKILNNLDINNSFYQMALMSIGFDTEKKQKQFIKYCNNALKRMINKIGKTIVKARKDLIEKKDVAVQLNNLKIDHD